MVRGMLEHNSSSTLSSQRMVWMWALLELDSLKEVDDNVGLEQRAPPVSEYVWDGV